jgi:hypothetical protein
MNFGTPAVSLDGFRYSSGLAPWTPVILRSRSSREARGGRSGNEPPLTPRKGVFMEGVGDEGGKRSGRPPRFAAHCMHASGRYRLPFLCRARTRVIKHTHNPGWEESFQVPVADKCKEIGFLLKDATLFGEVVSPLIDNILTSESRVVSDGACGVKPLSFRPRDCPRRWEFSVEEIK